MPPPFPRPPVAANDRAPYNAKWSWLLLLLNGGLAVVFAWNGFIDDYFHFSVGDWWLVPLVPGVLALLAWAAARSLPETEPGLVLSVQLGYGGKLSVAVLDAFAGHYARPTVLARFQPAWSPLPLAPYGAKNTQQYLDSLVSHLDSTQRALLRRPIP